MALKNKIDINKADQKTLESLSGIGPKVAQKIILHRKEQGTFTSIEEIQNVDGVTSKLYNQIKNYILIKPPDQEKPSDSTSREKVYLFGPPSNLKGMINLENSSKETKKSFKLRFGKESSIRLEGRKSGELKLWANLEAGEQRRLPIDFSIYEFTPPGIYQTTLFIEDKTLDMVIDVAEHIDVYLQPGVLFIEAEPGAVVEKPIYVTNNSNIPLEFGSPGAIVIEDDFIECRAIRGTVHSLKNAKELTEIAQLAACELEKLYEEAGKMRVTLKSKNILIQAGETRRVDLVFKLPSTLKRNNRYSGAIRFYDDGVNLKVITKAKAIG